MSIPINPTDYLRFLKIAKLIREYGNDKSTMDIYVNAESGYAHIDMSGLELPKGQLREFFQYQPSYDELEAAKKLLEEL